MNFSRIVCLTPSITETLYALEAGDKVVGVTDSCDYPQEVRSKPHVCSWFDPGMDRVLNLNPDLVLGLKTAHEHLASTCAAKHLACELFNPATMQDALVDILRLGELVGSRDAAQALVDSLSTRLAALDASVAMISPERRLTVARILDIDNDDLILAGPQSFQYDVIARAGGINVTSSFNCAYPKVAFQQFNKWDTDMIFLCGSDESYLLRLKADSKWQSLKAVASNRLHMFDCGLTCRTGPRIVDMAELLFQSLYGETVSPKEQQYSESP